MLKCATVNDRRVPTQVFPFKWLIEVVLDCGALVIREVKRVDNLGTKQPEQSLCEPSSAQKTPNGLAIDFVSEISEDLKKIAVGNQKLLAAESSSHGIVDTLLVRIEEKGDAV